MGRLTADQLRAMTLARQFPARSSRDAKAVQELVQRLGPLQSQSPRSPFLVAASRLPGVTYADVCALFESYRLVKTTTLRGTVHTSTQPTYACCTAVVRPLAGKRLTDILELTVDPDEVVREAERYCWSDWVERDDLVEHLRSWLAAEGRATAAVGEDSLHAALLWGHSGLIRRPRDGAWHRRTDRLHRAARAVLPGLARPSAEEALAELVRGHLAAYGPATRADLVYFFAASPPQIDTALTALGDEVIRVPGPDRVTFLDVAEPPRDGLVDPGLRLLPEFDGLLLGYAAPGRTRFCSAEDLDKIWARANALYAPVVLYDGRLVATWRTLSRGRRTDLEVRMLPGRRALPEDLFAPAVAATAAGLGVGITELRVHETGW